MPSGFQTQWPPELSRNFEKISKTKVSLVYPHGYDEVRTPDENPDVLCITNERITAFI